MYKDNMKKFDLKKMEELLPDYVFNKLTQAEREAFESNLNDYPQLVREIEKTEKVFKKVEAVNFDKIIEERTRNLSVKVQQRLGEKRMRQRKFYFAIRYAIPTLAVLIIAFLLIPFKFNNNSDRIEFRAFDKKAGQQPERITKQDNEPAVASNSGDIKTKNIIISKVKKAKKINSDEIHISTDNLSSDELASILDDYLDNKLAESPGLSEAIQNYGIGSSPYLLDKLNDLDDDDVKQIIKAIEDANSPS